MIVGFGFILFIIGIREVLSGPALSGPFGSIPVNKKRGEKMKPGRQRGFTLIEMLVALMIAGIFFSVFVGVIMATFETLRSGDERTVAQQNARTAINYMANDIRHATEIAPLRLEAYRDWVSGGFPINDNVMDPFTGTDAWPIYRQSVDGDPKGYIDLDVDGGTGDGDEYAYFRDDGFPYDVRALAPNRLSLTFFGGTYFPNTQYYALGLPIDLDFGGSSVPNPQTAMIRVTYEHQLVPPLSTDVYEPSFSGLKKRFDMAVNRQGAAGVSDEAEFVIVRSFEMENPTVSRPDVGETSTPAYSTPGIGSAQIRIDHRLLRQPLADHVINLRFRYWYIKGNDMIEIRYDPDMSHIGGNSTGTDDGYYRYFDRYGQEIYVWYNWDSGEMVPLLATDADEDDFDNVPPNSFYIDGGDSGTDEYQRGLLLFEGWRFVNAVSITTKTANNQTLNIYKSTINQRISSPASGDYDPGNADFGMGFIDFGIDAGFTDSGGDMSVYGLNAFEPLFQAADNIRASSTVINGENLFDFVEPNMNPNYDASTFTTLQTFVVPPALVKKADLAVRQLRFGLGHK